MESVRCLHCERSFPAADFEITRTIGEKIYRRRKCKVCKSRTQKQRVRRTSQWVIEFKKRAQCRRCGMSDHRVLTFHHRNATEKTGNVSDLTNRGWSLKRVQEEIGMCDVLCANCHLIEHFENRRLPSLEELIE